jgi:hypothetical protein
LPEFSGSANQKKGKIRPNLKKWPSMIRNVSLVNGQTDRLALPYTHLPTFQIIRGKLGAIGFDVAKKVVSLQNMFRTCTQFLPRYVNGY